MRDLYPGPSDPDPYPNYAWMRANTPVSPILLSRGPSKKWMITCYRDATEALTSPDLSADRSNAALPPSHQRPAEPAKIGRNLLGLDPPTHTRLRRLASVMLAPRAVQRWAPAISRICHDLIDEFAPQGRADLVEDYALRVPVAVIHEVMGVPPGQREDAGRCLELFLRSAFLELSNGPAVRELEKYLDHVIEYKRQNLGDDATSLLLDAFDRKELRDDAELYGELYVLLGAGHVTTVPFVSTALLRLLLTPHDPPDHVDTGDAAIEEVLRYDSPVQLSANRYALRDMEIHGSRIAKGDTVLISLAAANRDETDFSDADSFHPSRQANPHLAFGRGIHFCLGAALARLEAGIAVRTLQERLPSIELSVPPESVVWCGGPMLRGPRELPVIFG